MSDTGKAFTLQGPRDLLEKLDYDITRLARMHTTDERLVSFAALDCAVDAWSLVDWVWEWLVQNGRELALAEPQRDRGDFIKEIQHFIPTLSTCRQLATGAKHFRVRQGNREDVFTGVEAPDLNAPDNLFFAHRRFARAWVLEGSEGSEAYRLFERTKLDWIAYLDANRIDIRSG